LNSKISDKDKKDWENFLSNREDLPDKDNLIKNDEIKKEFTFDLHGYSLSDANDKISDLINKSFENGIRKLIIVTGKGLHSKNQKNPYVSKDLGILKYSVPEYIKNNFDLMKKVNSITEAVEKDGGGGAFYIYLKKKL
tara:strand:- start:849 stop:1262 length:414 start_codon:yes stop_codon:yes gene_type:complete